MARPRKSLATQTGHLKKNFKETRAMEEASIYSGSGLLDENKPPTELLNATAKKKWTEVVSILKPINVIQNADLSNLIGFCNAWAKYCEALKNLKKSIDPISRENAETKMLKFGKEFRDFGSKCGMDQNSRLKVAAENTNKKEKQIEEAFGDI